MATTIENFVLQIKAVGTETISRVQSAMKNLADQTAKTQNSLDDVGGKLNQFASQLGPVPAGVDQLAGSLGRLGGAGGVIGAVAVGFTALGLKAINMADELDDLSSATGISAGSLDNFKFSLMAAGGTVDSYSKFATKLSDSVGEAALGNEKLQKTFQTLGVYVTDANGNLRSNDIILRDVLKSLKTIEDPAIRAALATQLLGKEAAKIDWTNVTAIGDAIKDADVKRLAAYRAEMDKLGQTAGGILISKFGQLAQVINEMAAKKPEDGSVLDVLMTPANIGAGYARLNNLRKQMEDALAGGMAPADVAQENQRLLNRTGGGGTFGATPEATLKAVQANEDRIAQSRIEANRQAQLKISAETTAESLLVANQRQAIDIKADESILNARINLASDLAKERLSIFSQERLTDAQKEAAYQAKRLELESKTSKEIAGIRAQAAAAAQQARLAADAKTYSAYQAEREQIAKEQADEQTRINNIIKGANDLVNAYKQTAQETLKRSSLELQLEGLTERQKKAALEAFNIKREEARLLEQIANIKDLPYEERVKQEERINELTAVRLSMLENNATREEQLRQDFVAGWETAYNQFVENTMNANQQARDSFGTLTRGFEDSIVRFVQTGKLSFRGLFNDLIAQATRVAANRLLVSILGGLGGGGGGAGFLASLFGGPKAAGGPVEAGKAYVVGEKGPELFMPKSGGNIVPNHELGGSTNVTNVNYSIQAVDASSFRSLVARDPEFIFNVTEKGRRQLPVRSRR